MLLARRHVQICELSAAGSDDLPREFRIFKAGKNETSKGVFVFDDKAASDVMAAYKRDGVDLMIDLDHMSLDEPAQMSRTDCSDARGWFGLEVRGGELWATNVRWTPDGERRLREKTQRYISPAFVEDDGRISCVVNAALVGMPATHGAPALVAASKTQKQRTLQALSLLLGLLVQTSGKRKNGP